MQITLNQQEIEKAIISYVGQQGIAITGKNVSVSLSAGRGENRMSATIEISNDEIAASKSRGTVQAVEADPEDDAQMSLPFEASGAEPPPADLSEKPLFGV